MIYIVILSFVIYFSSIKLLNLCNQDFILLSSKLVIICMNISSHNQENVV